MAVESSILNRILSIQEEIAKMPNAKIADNFQNAIGLVTGI